MGAAATAHYGDDPQDDGVVPVSPTAEQAEVIDLPADARAHVVAGPGTGKTWTLLQRAVKLAERDEVGTADILVLSFTRAVVDELRKRDRGLAVRSWIRPETFDAFASRLLREHASDEAWTHESFDGRIAAATHLVETGAAAETLGRLRHILLDEVQDLVGVRADFVRTLVRAHEGGVTAFGDPAQGIYDHERERIGEPELDLSEPELTGERFALTENHRSTGDLADSARTLRQALLEDSAADAVDAVMTAYELLPPIGRCEELGPVLGSRPGSVAVLCRDNATALLISAAFFEEGVEHRVRRGTSDRPVSGWVGAALAGRASITKAALGDRICELEAVGFPDLPDVDSAWAALCRMDKGARGGAVKAGAIRSAIALEIVPWELYEEPARHLIVSSIHRAKGLEFDTCVVVEWDNRDEEDELLEARVRFVALTRARVDCFASVYGKRRRWYRAANAHDRFIKRGHEDWQTFGMEIRGGDVHRHEPGGDLAVACNPAELQETLIARVRGGDEVDLHFVGEHDFGHGKRPIYSVDHAREGVIGVTGSELGDALRRRLGRKAPARITGLHVDELETVAGSPDVADGAGLGRGGLWLRPRLVGLGVFQWKE